MNLASNRVLRISAYILQIAVAITFLFAASLKALDPLAFADQIRSYGIFPELSVFSAWFFIILEFLLAGGLILNLSPRIVPPLAIVLLSFFIGITVYGIEKGLVSSCGCFGNVVNRGPEQIIVEDILMIGALIFAFLVLFREKSRGARWKSVGVLGFGIIAAITIGYSYSLPVDSIVTQLRAGNTFSSWPVEGLSKDLNKNTNVVFLFSIHESSIDADISIMNTIAQLEGIPSCVGLIIDGTPELTTLMFQYAPAFPVGAIEPRFARTLYRKLPRTFILHNGTVVAAWSGIPTPEEICGVLAGTIMSEPLS